MSHKDNPSTNMLWFGCLMFEHLVASNNSILEHCGTIRRYSLKGFVLGAQGGGTV